MKRLMLSAILIIGAFVSTFTIGNNTSQADLWQYIFGLSGSNTEYDYMSAPISQQVYWDMHMCDNGNCLYERDWYCGFTNNDDDKKFENCFSRLVRTVKPWVKLDILRKYCGVSLAKFD